MRSVYSTTPTIWARQWKRTPNSPKLQHYRHLTIRLFNVIYMTHVGESYTSAEMQLAYSTIPAVRTRQRKRAPYSLKLQHYWNSTIRFKTFVRVILPFCRNATGVLFSPSRLGYFYWITYNYEEKIIIVKRKSEIQKNIEMQRWKYTMLWSYSSKSKWIKF